MARPTTTPTKTPTVTPDSKTRSAKPGVSADGRAKPRPASEVVAEALAAHPDRAAADLAALTGLGGSTVAKALAALEKAGHARRTTPETTGTAGARRSAARWQPVSTAPQAGPEPAAAQHHGPAAKTGSPKARTSKARTSPEQPSARGTAGEQIADGSAPARTGRLGKGELGTLVLEYLIAHPGDDLGPTAIGKALARSQGAVANCLTRLATSGDIVQTSDKPRRYRLAS
jgi:hypothetical protein